MMSLLSGCVKVDSFETKEMQNDIACDFGRNAGLPIWGHFDDTTVTLKQIAKTNHVYKCRCQSEGYIFRDECHS